MRRESAIYKITTCCLFFILCGSLRAADNPLVKYLGIEQGLSNNAVTCIYQDEKGFMWFGTYDGLNKYDGYGFTTYRNVIGDTNSLAFNNVATMDGDSRHNIWVGGQKGIDVFNPVTATFSTPFYLPYNGGPQVRAHDNTHIVKSVGDHYILAGTHSSGLLVFDEESRLAVQIPLPELSGPKNSYDVPSIEYDPIHKTIWVFVQKMGLYIYDLATRELRMVNNSIRDANCLRTDKTGRLWIGTDNGLFLLDDSKRTWSSNHIPQRSKVAHLCFDSRNACWIASDGEGVWRLPAGATMAFSLLSAAGAPLVNSNAVYAIYEDGDGRKWIGTLRGGINVIESKTTSFKTITYDPPGEKNIVNNFILSFCEDVNQDVWIGTDGAGLRYWNRKKNTFTEYLNNPSDETSIGSNFITGILRDEKNEIWVTTWFGGISRFNRSTGHFERFACFNPITNAEERHTWLLYEDTKKRLWASTTNDGCLYLFNRTANRFELFDEHIINLQSLTEDSRGTLWGGNYSSLIRIDREHKNHQTYTIGYPVRCLHEDRTGQFWVGTQEGGLLLFDRSSGQYRRFSTAEGLPSNTVLRILEDPNGNLWLSTYNGLSRFNPIKKTCRNFSPSDGLQSAQFSFNAGIRLTSGELLFGGIKGFNIFFPDSIGEIKDNLNVYLTRVRIRNTPIETSHPFVTMRAAEQIRELTLPFDQATLSLDFTALVFTGTDKINYAYSLGGWDKGWTYSNGSRTANYSSIREGSYFFKIKVSHADGTWGKETQMLHLVILPPWYRTWWAYLLYSGCFVGLILLHIQYTKTKERLRFEVKLAHLETEKEKELIERKLSFFTHITHEFRTPLTLIINPVKELLAKKDQSLEKESLPFVYRNAQRLLSLVDQLLLFRKTESGSDELKPTLVDIVELAREVYLCFVQGARTKKINYRFESSAPEIPLYADREKIEIALYNLLSNALKYTQEGGEVVFFINETAEEVMIEVKDNGLGIPAEVGDQLFDKFYQISRKETTSISGFGIGLYLVRQFVLDHKGKINYHSISGNGTTFQLQFRKGKDHLAGMTICHEKECGSPLFQEITEGVGEESEIDSSAQLITDLRSLLIVDDDPQLLSYISQVFEGQFIVFQGHSGEEGLCLAQRHRPDLVIADVHMGGISGIELCETIKNDPLLSQTPVILLTAAVSANSKLEGVRHGADDYITKPFDKELLIARVSALLKSRNQLQRYFYNEITLRGNPVRISEEYKEFLDKCIAIVEKNLGEDDFNIKKLSLEMGISHSNLYQKVKDISGQSVNSFIRFIRLRKAAELFINTDCNVNEAAMEVGINDGKYFREQFHKLFGVNPSEYIKKYRKVFSGKYLPLFPSKNA